MLSPLGEGETAFADGFPFLLVSQESMDELQIKFQSYVANLAKTSSNSGDGDGVNVSKKVEMVHFRPNIVVEGTQAFAEDGWDNIAFESDSLGQQSSDSTTTRVMMKVVKPCSRCKIPSIDPEIGRFDPDNTVTKVLKQFRSGQHLGFSKSSDVFFGQNGEYL